MVTARVQAAQDADADPPLRLRYALGMAAFQVVVVRLERLAEDAAGRAFSATLNAATADIRMTLSLARPTETTVPQARVSVGSEGV
jgi:hypothetical protein